MKREKMENKQNTNGTGGGFLLGLLVGILLALLFTTRKGREILRELIDKATEKLSDIDSSLEKMKASHDDEEESDYVKPDQEVLKEEIRLLANEKSEESAKKNKTNVNEKGGKQEKLSKRLFFKRENNK